MLPPAIIPTTVPPTDTVVPPPAPRYNTRALGIVMATTVCGLLFGAFRDEQGNQISLKRAKRIDAVRWNRAADEEQIRLVEENQVMEYVSHTTLPAGAKPSYYNQICSEKGPLARVRGTFGGDRLPKPTHTYEVAAYTSDMTTKKILLNYCVSNDMQFVVADIKNFFVNKQHKLSEPCYMWMNEDQISPAMVSRFGITDLLHNGRYLVKVTGAIYGHPEAAKISQDKLHALLSANGYYETEIKCLWRSRDPSDLILFNTHVDDFGIASPSDASARRLLDVITNGQYEITTDWLGRKYCGWTIHHDRVVRTLTLSMPGYVEKLLARFAHLDIDKLGGVDSPTVYSPPSYGKAQQTPYVDTTATLSDTDLRTLQEILGGALFLCISVRVDIATAINIVACRQAHPTQLVLAAAIRILRYLKKHPNRGLTFKASDMILKCHSDASYGSEPGFRSRSGGIYYFGNKDDDMINAPFQVLAAVQKTISASVMEAEYIALFENGQNVIAACNTLLTIGYPKQTVTIFTDNACAVHMANDELKPRRTKALDMRYHWTRQQVRDGNLIIKWIQGADNLADFFTKALPVHLHLAFMNLFTVLL
jgi:hypothetical protein